MEKTELISLMSASIKANRKDQADQEIVEEAIRLHAEVERFFREGRVETFAEKQSREMRPKPPTQTKPIKPRKGQIMTTMDLP